MLSPPPDLQGPLRGSSLGLTDILLRQLQAERTPCNAARVNRASRPASTRRELCGRLMQLGRIGLVTDRGLVFA